MKKTKAVLVRFDDEQYEQLAEIAVENDRPLAVEIRRAMRQYIDHHHKALAARDEC